MIFKTLKGNNSKCRKSSRGNRSDLALVNTTFYPASWTTKLHKQVGPGCLVCCLQLPRWGSDLLEHQWELDFRIVELLGAFSLAKLCGDGSGLNDLDAWKPHPVARRHLSVHLLDSAIQSSVPVFLVHVVITCFALVSQPYSEILDLGRILLKNLQ